MANGNKMYQSEEREKERRQSKGRAEQRSCTMNMEFGEQTRGAAHLRRRPLGPEITTKGVKSRRQ